MKIYTIISIFFITFILFSCSPVNKRSEKALNVIIIENPKEFSKIEKEPYEPKNIYDPCTKDSKDFYPIYKYCWNYGLSIGNCKDVLNTDESVYLIVEKNKNENIYRKFPKGFACRFICEKAVKKKTPTLSFSEYIKNCPTKAKWIFEPEKDNLYIRLDLYME